MIMLFMALTLCSMMLMISSHPVTIISLIIAQSLLICTTIWMLAQTSWFSYILFLIFLGGLMVLFMYIVSLASNEKFEPLMKETFFLVALISTIFVVTNSASFFMKNPQQPHMSFYMMTTMIFSSSIAATTMLVMTYLLLTLIVAVKISSKFEGPLRNFTK